jgi:hypothetical protein
MDTLPVEILDLIASNLGNDIQSLLAMRRVNRKWRWLCTHYFLKNLQWETDNALRTKALKHCFQNINIRMADHFLTERQAIIAGYANDQHFRNTNRNELEYHSILRDRQELFLLFPPVHMRKWRACEVSLADLVSHDKCRVPQWEWDHKSVQPIEPFDVNAFLRSLDNVLLWEHPVFKRWSVIEGCHRIVVLKNFQHLLGNHQRRQQQQIKVNVIIGTSEDDSDSQCRLDQYTWQ